MGIPTGSEITSVTLIPTVTAYIAACYLQEKFNNESFVSIKDLRGWTGRSDNQQGMVSWHGIIPVPNNLIMELVVIVNNRSSAAGEIKTMLTYSRKR